MSSNHHLLSQREAHRLPYELTQLIIWLAVSSSDDYVPSHFHLRYITLSAVRQVCRDWNSIALAMTRLWGRVAVDVTTSLSRYPPVDIVDLWMQRTQASQPIEILIAMPTDEDLTRTIRVREMWEFLYRYSGQWGELWYFSESGLGGFPQDLSRSHNLKKLSIDAGLLDEEAIDQVGPSFVGFRGSIRELDLEIATYDWIFHWGESKVAALNSLERVRLQYEGWTQGILNIFSEAATSLVSAQINADGQWSISPEYHDFDSDVQSISLTALRYLELRISDANLDLFNFLEMRVLEALDVSVNWNGLPDESRDILPLLSCIEPGRTDVLKYCTMQFDVLPSSWATLVFRSPTLSRLSTYRIHNVEVVGNTKEIIASAAPHNILGRISLSPEAQPGYFTIGWASTP
ncbi:hypothetical protein NP233_g7252 [Leucocoprinus birnbaumii]|uniref:F-box domain-containing protein n=1 Tax=Leucocoprinus birnbaumii TaxID=56174 RepID=A0AAD5VPN6_9AGAR|nr:hypothetical protein NP233_g7252 [Leucocoprinus birnbaumii]